MLAGGAVLDDINLISVALGFYCRYGDHNRILGL